MNRQNNFWLNQFVWVLGTITAVSIVAAAGFGQNSFPAPFVIPKAHAQDSSSSTPGTQKESGKKSKNRKETGLTPPIQDNRPANISDAESLVRLRATIEKDRKELEKTKADLKARQEIFDQSAEDLKELDNLLRKKKEELQAIQGKEPAAERSRLSAEIIKLQEDYDLEKKGSELLLQAVKTMQEQIKSLEGKIEKDQRALERLTGKDKPKEKEPPVPVGPPSAPEKETAPALLPLPPGVQLPEPRPPAGQEKKAPEEPATTEQIEARKAAERKKQEARKAGEAIVEVVDRKQALEDQIRLEKNRLKTIEEGKNYLEGLLAAGENNLKEKIAARAGQEELSRLRQEIAGLQKEINDFKKEIGQRKARLDDLNKELEKIEAEQVKATKEAELKRKEAEAARERSLWLESPLHPQNLWRWINDRGPQMISVLIAIAVLLLVIRIFARGMARLITRAGRRTEEQREKKQQTLAATIRGAGTGVVLIGGLLLFLQQAGVDITTLLGGAAVIGLAIAFGAQNLMRDFFNGIMILWEGQYELNDVVMIGDVAGVVERMTMRVTVLRDLEGRAHFIPNGEIKRVTNLTHEWSQAVFDIGVGYGENVDRVMGILMELAGELRKDPKFTRFILDEPQMLGVDLFSESGIIVKFTIKTKAAGQWAVKRELLRRIKNRFDELGIRIPVPHRMILQEEEIDRKDREEEGRGK